MYHASRNRSPALLGIFFLRCIHTHTHVRAHIYIYIYTTYIIYIYIHTLYIYIYMCITHNSVGVHASLSEWWDRSAFPHALFNTHGKPTRFKLPAPIDAFLARATLVIMQRACRVKLRRWQKAGLAMCVSKQTETASQVSEAARCPRWPIAGLPASPSAPCWTIVRRRWWWWWRGRRCLIVLEKGGGKTRRDGKAS